MDWNQYADEWILLFVSGWSYDKIADMYEVLPEQVKQVVSQSPTALTRKPDEQIIDEWAELYTERRYTVQEIGKKYGFSTKKVIEALEQKGIYRKRRRKYDHLLPQFIQMYEEGIPLAVIGGFFGCSPQTVQTYLTGAGVDTRSISEANRRLPVLEHYFDAVETKEKAYDLGLVFAMGSLRKEENRLSVYLGCSLSKKPLLDRIVKAIGPAKIRQRGKYQYATQFYSAKLYKTLENWGLKGNKKKDMTFPSLSDFLLPFFIKGYFDGIHGKTKNLLDENGLVFTGSTLFLQELYHILMKLVDPEEIRLMDSREAGYAKLVIPFKEASFLIKDWLQGRS